MASHAADNNTDSVMSSNSTHKPSSQKQHSENMSFTHPRPVASSEIDFDLSKRRKGTCKFFNSQKGFGFIHDDQPEQLGNQEVFVHYTSIGSKGGFRSLAEGEEVEYVLSPGQKGFQANEVTGPSGRAVQGDVKSKPPKTPTLVPYPMGIMPAGYAIAGTGSPYVQQDPYMPTSAHPGVYGSPYGQQLFYVPSTVGLVPAAHSPSLNGVSPYPTPQTGPHSARSPTVPYTHHPSSMGMSLASPQPNGFGFASPSMAYGLGGSSGVVGSAPGGHQQPHHHNPGLGFRSDMNSQQDSSIAHRGGGGSSRSDERHGGDAVGAGGHGAGAAYTSHHHHHHHHQNGSSSLLYSSNNPVNYQ